ncbi:MAG: transcription-repair coupling factor [Gammaproteobacteria bacterium RIFCSPHIGHO2_12_FULL_35_23]|nr:MAG: transcription-repair coupling factor [Gammaproteobacteria bacterium RIFCSPHIGHO2_12_FULL_35_23]
MSAHSLFKPLLPTPKQPKIYWGQLHGCAHSLAIAEAIKQSEQLNIIVTPDNLTASKLEEELRFFLQEHTELTILRFPEWETLPYDLFSPHQDIISERLLTLTQLTKLKTGVLLTSISSLMNKIAPAEYLIANCFTLKIGDQFTITTLRKSLQQNAYRCVNQVNEHGDFAVRGAIIDVFPMGAVLPYRIELFDEEVETIRTFDPETQRSLEKLAAINLLPATEYSLSAEGIEFFRAKWRSRFPGNPTDCPIYQEVSQGITSPGIEYYIPLFFEKTATLLDLLPKEVLVFRLADIYEQANHYWQEINNRYEQLAHDRLRPILFPTEAFLPVNDLFMKINQFSQVELQTEPLPEKIHSINFATDPLPNLTLNHKLKNPLINLQNYLASTSNKILFCAETTGRREVLLGLFKTINLTPVQIHHWQEFLQSSANYCIVTYPLDDGLISNLEKITIIAESQLVGERILQRRRRKKQQTQEADALIKNLAELSIGDPIVHIEHGVGRYLGLQIITLDNRSDEYVTLSYAFDTKLYVPVSSLHLISRYTGADPEHAPLHKLGTDQWQKAKRKAAEKIRDAAAELLEIYARRAAQHGFQFKIDEHYQNFCETFPFEETPGQLTAIQQVLEDMQSEKTMDRLVCGDVGFGKTEVAMRAAFVAANNNKQVVLLAPTTLLAQQHYQNFKDRFADWPIEIEVLSRFRTTKEQKLIIERLENGKIDIVIGTHKLLNKTIRYANLGLLIIDEEHRFGVKQKEQLKALRANIDILTLTATPIPRTLNMAFAGIRDLSVIATPPIKRLAIKTFIQKRNNNMIREAILREIWRGGQVYFLYNKVETIEQIAREMAELVPEAKIGIGHGQMRERELEQVMADFYHRRFNVLIATTIIESGIDIPNANTIIIDRADHFGLAQLHQLRGRVGRSHHQAYAYLLIPDKKLMTAEAEKRLEAIASLKDLGIGFTLATHDLEIRGAGELLGEEQSGQMIEIGFNLYMDMLERAVNALKKGKKIDLEQPLDQGPEIDLKLSTIIPEDYLPDVHSRLILYKRIASAENQQALDELQSEMVDRFGLLPDSIKNLLTITSLKFIANEIGIKKLEASSKGGKIHFQAKPAIEPTTIIKLIQQQPNAFKLLGSDKLSFHFAEEINIAEKRIMAIKNILSLLK